MKHLNETFKYDKKESYTQAELDEILGRADGFFDKKIAGTVSKEDHDKLLEELKPYKAKDRDAKIKSLVGDLTDEDKLADALALAGLTETDEDDVIKSKVKDAIDKRPYLQKAKVDDSAAAKAVEKKESIVPKAPAKAEDSRLSKL